MQTNATTFAIQQCLFGADTPKPTRFLTTLLVNDSRCHFGWPQFRDNSYVGPLPKSCGHMRERKFIGHTDGKWNTGPTAAYLAGLCQFIADASQSIGRGQDDTSLDLKRTDTSLDLKRTPQPLGALVGAPGVSSASVAPGKTSLSSETGVAPESTSLSSEIGFATPLESSGTAKSVTLSTALDCVFHQIASVEQGKQ